MSTEETQENILTDGEDGDTSRDDYSDNISIEQGSVSYSYTQHSISTMINRLEKRIIDIPTYQRRFVWKKEQATLLIDSILRGLPIPPVVLFKNPTTKRFELLDGLQRMLSIYYFIKNQYPTDPEVYLPKELASGDCEEFCIESKFLSNIDSAENNTKQVAWLNKYYSDLDEILYDGVRSYKDIFDDYIIGILEINLLTPSYETSLELFSRLNTGGTKLEINEIRMRYASEETLNKIRNLIKSEYWEKLITPLTLPRKDTSRELVLRLLVLLDRYNTSKKILPMHRMLDKLMEQEYQSTESPVLKLLQEYENFIKQALKLIFETNITLPFVYRSSKRLNSSIAETIIVSVAFGLYKQQEISTTNIIGLINQLNNPSIRYKDEEYQFRGIMGNDSAKVKSILIRHSIATTHISDNKNYLNAEQIVHYSL